MNIRISDDFTPAHLVDHRWIPARFDVKAAPKVFGYVGSRRGIKISWALVGTLFWWTLSQSAMALQVQDETKIALSGFSLSEAFSIVDNQQFEVEETNLMKLVYRLRQTSLSNLEKYSQYTRDAGWEKLLADPPGHRLQVFYTAGRVKSVEGIRLSDPDQELRQVYRVRCVSNEGQPFEVVSLTVPLAWLKTKTLDEPMFSLGFFYALILAKVPEDAKGVRGAAAATGEQAPDSDKFKENESRPKSIPLFLAKQISWRPTQPNLELGVKSDHVLLAQHGVDLAALDFVRQEDRKRMGASDARPFYQMLDAVFKIGEPNGLQSISHMELLRNPRDAHGLFVQFQARVKKCSVVRPPADSATNAIAKDPYYQLIVFPDLRDSRDEPTVVELGRGADSLSYRRFPFTVCCRELPPEMTPASIENQQVWINGFHYRFWLYDSERTTSAGVSGQISPLIIGTRPQMIESNFGSLIRFSNSLLLVFIGVLAIVVFTIFRISKRSQASKEPLPEKLDIDGLAEM